MDAILGKTFPFMKRILAHSGNVFVSSDDDNAQEILAKVIADRFAVNWMEGSDETKPLFVDITDPRGRKIRYMVTPTDTYAEPGSMMQ